jgi:ribose/xylose/arabinose/galactoside ABC-type transport system permease subunit
VKVFFVDSGFVIDLVGLAWLGLSIVLLMFANRQRIGISWVWVSLTCQAFVAALGAVFVSLVMVCLPLGTYAASDASPSLGEQVSSLSLPIIVGVAVVLWCSVLAWMLAQRARYGRRGPSLRDGLRTNVDR